MIDVDFILPAYNEEQSIGLLIQSITDLYPQAKVIVIDNNSKDKTAQIAEDMGAEVIFEKKQGKAHAIQKGFSHSKSKYMIMLDADNTYDPKDALKLLEPVMNEEADMVLGSRLKGEKEKGAISNTNMVGNHILSLIASLFYNPISDVCTGYWVFTREVIDYLLNVGIDCAGFEVEAEMFAKVSKGNFRIKERPILYKNRVDEAKLSSFEDGFKILKTLFKYKFKNINLYIGALIFFELMPALILLDTLYII
jgi:glycosyltransferase involved in cell wall biosynthesis